MGSGLGQPNRAPKIGLVIPIVSKGGIHSSRNMSQGPTDSKMVGSTPHGSAGAISTQPLGAQIRPKKGSCNAVIQRGKGQVQIHDSLGAPQIRPAQPRASSRHGAEGTENIEADECVERKAYKINNLVEPAIRDSRHSGINTNRSRDRAAMQSDQPV